MTVREWGWWCGDGTSQEGSVFSRIDVVPRRPVVSDAATATATTHLDDDDVIYTVALPLPRRVVR